MVIFEQCLVGKEPPNSVTQAPDTVQSPEEQVLHENKAMRKSGANLSPESLRWGFSKSAEYVSPVGMDLCFCGNRNENCANSMNLQSRALIGKSEKAGKRLS